MGQSVGTAKDDHVLREVGQVLAQFLVLLILAFICLWPQLHPGVLPDDVAEAGGKGGREGRPFRRRPGKGGRGEQAQAQAHAQGRHSLRFFSPQVRGKAP